MNETKAAPSGVERLEIRMGPPLGMSLADLDELVAEWLRRLESVGEGVERRRGPPTHRSAFVRWLMREKRREWLE